MSSPPPVARTSLLRIRQVRSIFVMALLGISSFSVLLSALPVWAVQVGVAPGLAGTVTTVMLAATVVVQIASPALIRRFSIRALLVWGVVLLGLPSPFYLLAHELWSLYLISALRGVGFALLTVVAALAIQQATPRERQGEAVGVYGLAAALPTMLGVAVGAGLSMAGHFAVVAWASGATVLGVLAAAGVSAGTQHDNRADDRTGSGGTSPSDAPTAIGVLRQLVAPLGLLFVATAVGGGVITMLPLELADGGRVTAALLVFGAVTALARWRIGHLTDRRGHRGVPQVLVAVGVAGLVVLAFGLAGPSWPLIFLGGALAGVAYGALQSASLDIAFSRVPRSRAAVASAAWNAFFDAGTAVGAAALVGLAATTLGGPGSVAVAAAVFAVTGVVVTVVLIVARRLGRRDAVSSAGP